jgi:diaminopimelate epimerase
VGDIIMKFTKMHGAGNDYIYIDCFNQSVENPCELSKKLSDRHFGIGGDGIVLIKPSSKADCFMDIYNADGSRAQMCGNAVRCTAKYIYDNRINKHSITVDTLSGIKNVEILLDCCRVNMGKPVLNGRLIPTRYGDGIVRDKILNIDDVEYKITCVSMGNPHCVVFCDDVDKIDLYKIGPLFERHEMFPERINTEFAEILDENCLKMSVWERGSGETLACGTGACAVGVASVINGICLKNEEITVQAKGGILKVQWCEDNNVYLTGEAHYVFDGEI